MVRESWLASVGGRKYREAALVQLSKWGDFPQVLFANVDFNIHL